MEILNVGKEVKQVQFLSTPGGSFISFYYF